METVFLTPTDILRYSYENIENIIHITLLSKDFQS